MKFINRYNERDFLNEEYQRDSASLIVIYGRRMIARNGMCCLV